MTAPSATDLLVLHAVRITGYADTAVLADRFDLDEATAEEHLGDAEAWGWVQRSRFADLTGWSLTDAGRIEGERRLAAELTASGGRAAVAAAYEDFLPLNGRLQQACTQWQLRPQDGDRFAVNDHSDPDWDHAVLTELGALDTALTPLNDRLSRVLSRFDGYSTRFGAALVRARSGETGFVDRTDLDSCHRVWFELHEDLVATLGIDRQTST